jgi:hypothetical protein
VLQIGFFGLFGIYATNVLIQRYSEGPLNPLLYGMIILGAAGSYWPLNWMANLVGACLVVLVVVLSARRGRVQAGVPAS